MFGNLCTKGKSSDGTSSSINSLRNLNTDELDYSLNSLFDAYSELCQNGYDDKITSIVLYPIPRGDIGIDVLLDGSYFLSRMKNDILTSFYILPDGEDPNTFHFRRTRLASEPVSNRELNLYLSSYKQRNSDKGDFLNLIKIH